MTANISAMNFSHSFLVLLSILGFVSLTIAFCSQEHSLSSPLYCLSQFVMTALLKSLVRLNKHLQICVYFFYILTSLALVVCRNWINITSTILLILLCFTSLLFLKLHFVILLTFIFSVLTENRRCHFHTTLLLFFMFTHSTFDSPFQFNIGFDTHTFLLSPLSQTVFDLLMHLHMLRLMHLNIQ